MDQQYSQLGITSFNPLQNFKGFATTRPPLLVFLICLLAFALTAASLAFVVHRNDLRDPSFNVDWNDVLSKLTSLDVCVHNNSSLWKSSIPNVLNEEAPSIEPTDDSLLNFPNDVSQNSLIGRNNFSVSLSVQLKFGKEIKFLANNVTTITGFVCRHVLGFTDDLASEQIGVTVDFPSTHLSIDCNQKGKCQSEFPICITFHGLSKLPVSKKVTTCSASSSNVSLLSSAAFTVAQCNDKSVFSGKMHKKEPLCDGTLLPMSYQFNPEWSVFLSEHERALINLHLMYTSYFLLVMAMTLVCYAIIRGRPKQKILIAERMPLET